MSVLVDAARLQYELAIRGMSANDLAKKIGVSAATMSAIRHGRRIAETSLRLIAGGLEAIPVNAIIERLLGPFETWARGH